MNTFRRGPDYFRVCIGSSHVDAVARRLGDGGLLLQVGHAGGDALWGGRCVFATADSPGGDAVACSHGITIQS